MKTFEEKWTAWLDGQLTGQELEDFEAALPDKEAAEAEKRDATKLGTLLKQELGAQPFSNEEFFSHQLRERIARESSKIGARSTWWTVPRLVWAGAVSVALFMVCAVVVMNEETPGEQSDYLTQILNMRVDPAVSPNATVSKFETTGDGDRVTVIWTEGLQSLPSDYAAK